MIKNFKFLAESMSRKRAKGSRSGPRSSDEVPAQDRWRVGYIKKTISGSHYFVPGYASHRPAARAILEDRFYEPDTHDFIRHIGSQEDGDLIHAGTFFGDMIPSFSRSVSAGVLYCFEPVLESYVLARLCVSENQLENVLLFNAALSDEVANLRINTVNARGRHKGGASEIAETGTIVPSMKIDQFSFRNLICIQLDVEGHEINALRGARRSIDQHQPIILVEDNNRECAPFLRDCGYELYGKMPGLKVWTSPKRKALVSGFAGIRV